MVLNKITMSDLINKENLDKLVVTLQQEMLKNFYADEPGHNSRITDGMEFAIKNINTLFKNNYESDVLALQTGDLCTKKDEPVYSHVKFKEEKEESTTS